MCFYVIKVLILDCFIASPSGTAGCQCYPVRKPGPSWSSQQWRHNATRAEPCAPDNYWKPLLPCDPGSSSPGKEGPSSESRVKCVLCNFRCFISLVFWVAGFVWCISLNFKKNFTLFHARISIRDNFDTLFPNLNTWF